MKKSSFKIYCLINVVIILFYLITWLNVGHPPSFSNPDPNAILNYSLSINLILIYSLIISLVIGIFLTIHYVLRYLKKNEPFNKLHLVLLSTLIFLVCILFFDSLRITMWLWD